MHNRRVVRHDGGNRLRERGAACGDTSPGVTCPRNMAQLAVGLAESSEYVGPPRSARNGTPATNSAQGPYQHNARLFVGPTQDRDRLFAAQTVVEQRLRDRCGRLAMLSVADAAPVRRPCSRLGNQPRRSVAGFRAKARQKANRYALGAYGCTLGPTGTSAVHRHAARSVAPTANRRSARPHGTFGAVRERATHDLPPVRPPLPIEERARIAALAASRPLVAPEAIAAITDSGEQAVGAAFSCRECARQRVHHGESSTARRSPAIVFWPAPTPCSSPLASKKKKKFAT